MAKLKAVITASLAEAARQQKAYAVFIDANSNRYDI